MRFSHHAKLLALGAALAGLVIVPSIGEVSTATGEPACGPIVSIGGNDFHQVSTEQQLREVGRAFFGNCGPSSNYLLTNDITLVGGDWTPIPNLGGPTFEDDLFGVFDGGGHTISGLTVNSTGNNQRLAMFAAVGDVTNEPGVIRNLRLDNVTVTTTHTNTLAGGLVGQLEPDSQISQVHVSGSIVLESTGARAGLIVGEVRTASIEFSSSSGTVDGSHTNAGNYGIGGLAGEVAFGTVSNSYSTATVKAKSGNNQIAGGLVGVISDTTVTNSFSSGPVEGSDSVGGLIGVGLNTNTVSDSFWDTETSTQNQSAGGTGKTTTEMKQLATYTDASWAIVSGSGTFDPPTRVWGIDPSINEGYPYLLWEVPACGLLSEDSFHEIRTPSQLRHVGSGGFGAGECGLGAKYRLMASIDLENETDWLPLPGAWVDSNYEPAFDGTFDGNSDKEFSISNLWSVAGNIDDVGLFAILGFNAEVSDLRLEGFEIEAQGDDAERVGALAGTNRGKVNSVVVFGSTVSSNDKEVLQVGGLIGLNTGEIETVTMEAAEVHGSGGSDPAGNTGGVIGRNSGADAKAIGAWFLGGNVEGHNKTGGVVGENVGGAQVIRAAFMAVVEGNNDVGGVVGENNSGVVRDSEALRTTSSVAGNNNVGGLVGQNRGGGTVSRSLSEVQVRVTGAYSGAAAGGLIGENSASIAQSFASGSVSGGAITAGGLVGKNLEPPAASSFGTILDSYATGNVTVDGGTAGGLIGQNTSPARVDNSYSTGKIIGHPDSAGMSGNNDGSASGVYFDFQSTGLDGGPFSAGFPKSSSELRQLGIFTGWDISESATPTTVWGIHPTRNAGYPFLAWQYPEGTTGVSAFCEPAEPSLLDPSASPGANNPYLVSHPRHLLWLAGADIPTSVNTDNLPSLEDATSDKDGLVERLSASYKQVAPFSLAECDWLPIGIIQDGFEELPFRGFYDGNSQQLIGLTVGGPGSQRVQGVSNRMGLFGVLQGTVSHLELIDAEVSGVDDVGVVAGRSLGGFALTGVKVVNAKVTGERDIGGLVGFHSRENSDAVGFSVSDCSVEVQIQRVGTGDVRAGGLFGFAHEAKQVQTGDGDQSASTVSGCVVVVEFESQTGNLWESLGGVIGEISQMASDAGTPDGNNRIAVSSVEVDAVVRASGNIKNLGGVVGEKRAIVTDTNVVLEIRNDNEVSDIRLGNTGGVGGLLGRARAENDIGSRVSGSTVQLTTVGEFLGGSGFGGLVGYDERTEIDTSSAHVNITLRNPGPVGGLVGELRGGSITTSKASGSIELAPSASSSERWGGLIGRAARVTGGSVTSSYSDVTLSATISSANVSSPTGTIDVGGLIGVADTSDTLVISDSYSNSTLTITDEAGVANAGAFIGRVEKPTRIDNSFYNSTRVSPSLDTIGKVEETLTGAPQALLANQINRIAPFADAGWAIVPATVTSLPSGPTDEIWGIVEGGTCGPFLWWEEGKAVSCQAPVTSGSGGSSGSSSNRPSATEPEVDGTILLNPVPRGTNLLQGATDNDAVVLPSTPEPSGTDTSDGDTTAEVLTGEEATDAPAPLASTDSGGMGVLWMLALGGLGLLAAGGATAAVLRARGRMV